MKKYTDKSTGKTIVELEDLSFLSERNHHFNWLQRHFHHHRLRLWLRSVDLVYVPDGKTATDLTRYYFLSPDKIVIR